MNKYNARRTTVDGIMFDSKREAARYKELQLLLHAREISDLTLQPKFLLWCGDNPLLTPTGRQMHYRADFGYRKGTQQIYEDVKGRDTKLSQLKRAVLSADRGIDVVIVK